MSPILSTSRSAIQHCTAEFMAQPRCDLHGVAKTPMPQAHVMHTMRAPPRIAVLLPMPCRMAMTLSVVDRQLAVHDASYVTPAMRCHALGNLAR